MHTWVGELSLATYKGPSVRDHRHARMRLVERQEGGELQGRVKVKEGADLFLFVVNSSSLETPRRNSTNLLAEEVRIKETSASGMDRA